MDSALVGEKQLNVRLTQPHLLFRTVRSVRETGRRRGLSLGAWHVGYQDSIEAP